MKNLKTISIIIVGAGVTYFAYKLYKESQRIKSRRSGYRRNENLQEQYPSLLELGNVTKNTSNTTTTALTEKQKCERNFGIWRFDASGRYYCDKSTKQDTTFKSELYTGGGGPPTESEPNKTIWNEYDNEVETEINMGAYPTTNDSKFYA